MNPSPQDDIQSKEECANFLPSQLEFRPGGITVPPTAGIELLDFNRSRLIAAANAADAALGVPNRLPSLHILADAIFSTSPPSSLKQWADAMVISDGMTVARALAELPQPAAAGRPCGYVFKRGDIAWNCRQCQQDPTCVICDSCFQASDHTGHEVYFHRTAPGGCCDCGDAEAWEVPGCCPQHRPVVAQPTTAGLVDPMEAVRALENSKSEVTVPFLDALDTVVKAAVYAITEAVKGTGRASDASRFTVGNAPDAQYQLRLHNDDVHTFDEVIQALQQLGVEDAQGLTRQVDSDGQVIVLTNQDQETVLNAFQLMKKKGLACAAVTVSQIHAEQQAQALCAWLTEIGTAHPEAAQCIVRAFEGPTTSARYIPPFGNFDWFPKEQDSSYLTSEEQYELFGLGEAMFGKQFTDLVKLQPTRPPSRFGPPKSPHALWGTLLSQYAELSPNHPFLNRFRTDPSQTTQRSELTGQLYVVDTDIRKQQEGEVLASETYPHDTIPGLHLLASGANPMQYRHLLQVASFRAPLTPLLLLLLLDPYPTKQLRQALHAIYLSMLTNPRFKARFAGALSVAYRPLTTLFCAGVGTEADTPLQFTVQIFTAGSLVRALQHGPAVEALLRPETMVTNSSTDIGCFVPPIAHCITRCVHTNILGSTKEVNMALKHHKAAASLVFQPGEHPVYTLLSAAPDDAFLDARSTRHKRLPSLLRDLDYVMDTPHTATALLANTQFVAAWCRLLRLAQGMDPQKRRISGGHVEYETNRWLEAFALSLSLSRDAVAENCSDAAAVGNGMAGLLREIKLWLFREGILQTGLPVADRDHGTKLEALQTSTLHIGSDALACATGVKMTEHQLAIFENLSGNPVDSLRIPHSPMAGNALSFHIPLHRAFAKCVKSICALTPDYDNPEWWKIPILDDNTDPDVNPLAPILRPTVRPMNCRVVWSGGPDCTSTEAQRRKTKIRNAAGNIAVAKVIHSLADHPARCLAAALQIERHLWARNGNSVAAMAMNYSSAPLSRSFRDLDLLMVQLSATGMSCGLGPRRIFSLLLTRFGMDGYLVDPEHKVGKWINPPRLQDPEHATILTECFFTMLCVLVTELPSPAEMALHRNVRRELLHALAAEPRTHSEASQAASCAISRKEESEGAFREIFTETLREVGKQKSAPGRGSSGPPVFELKPEVCEEYDPSFFHIRRQEHQHAMDVIARLRKQKLGDKKETHCLPLVCAPPKAHMRFLPCRLILHLDTVDAAMRRALLFALTNGSWLPPDAPQEQSTSAPLSPVVTTTYVAPSTTKLDVPVTSIRYRTTGRRSSETDGPDFSSEVVASSSVSFLEVLQLLTLQVHTLEECASLHREMPDLDEESRNLSASLSINSYLQRLIYVPDSLSDAWALKPYPDGPLRSSGSGEKKGSILGLLIALYEHRGDGGGKEENDDYGPSDEGHGGARALVSSGLKWLLRFVHALIDGAISVGAAVSSATTGVPISKSNDREPVWTISTDVHATVSRMLKSVPDLWPKTRCLTASPGKTNPKGKEAMKAKQRRVMEMMKLKQNAFAASMGPLDDEIEMTKSEEVETCIICRCDDSDIANNGPLGYLGHVQRSRMTQLRASHDTANDERIGSIKRTYRVVGHMGCQLRETEAMDSTPLACLPKGSVVTAVRVKVSDQHDILSRRILVKHLSKDPQTGSDVLTEGWASVQSSQGYVILSPLETLCYSSSRWGTTRPIIKQCGHAAHLNCVATHTNSLKTRAAGEQPYDGRFAANIQDGEFLCPLCKQLSNVLIPKTRGFPSNKATDISPSLQGTSDLMGNVRRKLTSSKPTIVDRSPMERKALVQFGKHLYDAMNVPWERAVGEQKKRQEKWHKAILTWDFEEDDSTEGSHVGNALRILRQQLIAWASVGHSASALEAGARGVEEVLPFGVLSQTSDPWPEYSLDSMDSHPMLLDLKRTITGAAGLYEVLKITMVEHFAQEGSDPSNVVGSLLSDVLDGRSWVETFATRRNEKVALLWGELTSLFSSIPCHVARDGTIAIRCEARATAASMWVCKGSRRDPNPRNNPPIPLPIQQLLAENSRSSETVSNWGTEVLGDSRDKLETPFRPAIASGFLHFPLITWDLQTFAGAMFSSLLSSNDEDLPSIDELLHVVHRLLVARIVQAIVTPGGMEISDEMDLDEDEVWSDEERPEQAKAMTKLVLHCQALVAKGLTEAPSGLLGEDSDVSSSVLMAIGNSILPFARSSILLLRAFTAAIRERQNGEQPQDKQSSVVQAICHNEIMVTEDAFKIVRDLRGPLPTDLVGGSWLELINRWVIAGNVFDMHHGSTGRSLLGSGSFAASRPTNVQRRAEDGSESGMVVDHIIGMSENRTILSDDSTDGMEVEETEDRDIAQAQGDNFILINEDGDVDQPDSMDEAEEMVSFAAVEDERMEGETDDGDDSIDANESSDDNSSVVLGNEDLQESDSTFANLGRSPILPFQPSFLGLSGVGPGRHNSMFDFVMANKVMVDLSHLGTRHKRETPSFTLIRLPMSFVELYNIVNKVKGRDESSTMDDDDGGTAETAICLLTGAVMRSGASRSIYSRSNRPPGACTLHGRKTASGIGIFFLVQKCTVLLMHNNKSAYSPSLYVDEHGEEDPQLKRGKPLFLNEARYRALELLWRQQGIPREVAQIRSTSDRVIRDNWY